MLISSDNISHTKYAHDDINVGGIKGRYPATQSIGVVGGGYSGSVSAMNSLKAATFYRDPIKINIYERKASQRCGGLAYGKDTALNQHYLNIQPHRLTTDRQHPADCVNYLSCIRKDSINDVNKENSLSRHEYGQYIKNCLDRALVNAPPGSTVSWIDEEVTSVKPNYDGVHILVNGNKLFDLYDSAIIATGIQIPKKAPDFIKGTSGRYIHTLYSSSAYQQIENISKESNATNCVVIIGTGLSAFDAVIALRAKGFKGKIICMSTGGNVHYRYDENHKHSVGMARRPKFLDFVQVDTSVSEIECWVTDYILEELKNQKEIFPHSVPGVHLENIMKASEPYISELISKLAPETTVALLRKHKSFIGTRRVGVIPRVYDFIQGELNSGCLEIKRDNFISAVCQEDKIIYETKSFDGKPEECDLLINATGDTHDYKPGRVHDLWSELLLDGKAVPHFLGGVQVDGFGRMIDKNGRPVDGIYLSGPMTSGDSTERRGRLGAFQINTGELRDRAEVSGKNVVSKKHGELLELAQNKPDASGKFQRVKKQIIKV